MAEDMTQPEAPEVTADQSASEKVHSGKPTISVKVYAPFKVYFEGEAYSLSAVNATGPFDVLPKHHNFLCMLVPCELKIQTPDNGEKTIKLHRALMRVSTGHVSVFVDV
ncbi:MAG: hypothetical protein EOO17_04225 [Chloroflexi bacterium]|nr:MAG: hypothetical protein EOO17_04225 [Chloroflexota bacterium]